MCTKCGIVYTIYMRHSVRLPIGQITLVCNKCAIVQANGPKIKCARAQANRPRNLKTKLNAPERKQIGPEIEKLMKGS
jgi:hypothetical protein